MNLLILSSEYLPTAGNPEHGNGREFTPSELAYLSELLAESRERAPDVFRAIEKAAANPTSLRAAINGKCFDCQGGPSDAGGKQRIGVCSVRSCCLWPVRPYQRSAED